MMAEIHDLHPVDLRASTMNFRPTRGPPSGGTHDRTVQLPKPYRSVDEDTHMRDVLVQSHRNMLAAREFFHNDAGPP